MEVEPGQHLRVDPSVGDRLQHLAQVPVSLLQSDVEGAAPVSGAQGAPGAEGHQLFDHLDGGPVPRGLVKGCELGHAFGGPRT